MVHPLVNCSQRPDYVPFVFEAAGDAFYEWCVGYFGREFKWREGQWPTDAIHTVFAALAFLYLPAVLSARDWMRRREAFDLKLPLALWNATAALLSGIAAWYR